MKTTALGWNRYGKSRVRLVKVRRQRDQPGCTGERHRRHVHAARRDDSSYPALKKCNRRKACIGTERPLQQTCHQEAGDHEEHLDAETADVPDRLEPEEARRVRGPRHMSEEHQPD